MSVFITATAHIHTYMYKTIDFFHISKFLVVPSVDHLNMNKLLTTDYLHYLVFLQLPDSLNL